MLSIDTFKSVFPEFGTSEDQLDMVLAWMGPNQLLQPPSEEVASAIDRSSEQRELILEQYKDSMRGHFVQFAQPIIRQGEIIEVASMLKNARIHYEYPLQYLAVDSLMESGFDRDFKALVREALPFDMLNTKMMQFYQQHRIHELDQALMDVYCTLCDMGLAREMEKILANVLREEVYLYIHESYAGQWDQSVIQGYKEWAQKSLEPAVQKLVGYGFGKQLVEIGDDALTALRITELFDIVVDYPDSIPALKDLKSTMKTSEQRRYLVSVFQQSCQKRLLQGGANTVDIISGYISTIRAFSILEPRGVLLNYVSKPIRRYLRERDDTIKIIVAGLLGDETSSISELASELATKKQEEENGEDDLLDLNWNPDPVDAPPDFMKGKDDIVSSLTTLYDNRDIFVKEFVDIFADRMLRQDCVNDVMEKQELLKMRFGEREMQTLDVMVRDMLDSKRLDKQVHDEAVRGKPIFKKFHGSILSRLFWPKFRSAPLELPPIIINQMELYSQRFSQVKPNRKLKWIPNLGTVKLEIQLEDRNVEVDATPEQAAIIAFFQDGPKSLADVEQSFKMTAPYARQIVLFWVHKGVLKQRGDLFIVREKDTHDEADDDDNEIVVEEAEAESNIQSAEDRAKEEMGFYWQYIQGMLTNLGATPLDRIHSFLKMVVPKETPYTKSVEDLEQFLNLMVTENKLVVNGSDYKLNK